MNTEKKILKQYKENFISKEDELHDYLSTAVSNKEDKSIRHIAACQSGVSRSRVVNELFRVKGVPTDRSKKGFEIGISANVLIEELENATVQNDLITTPNFKEGFNRVVIFSRDPNYLELQKRFIHQILATNPDMSTSSFEVTYVQMTENQVGDIVNKIRRQSNS